ncbi:MAG TPA: hypothetical protein VJU18_00670 [Vicinamibacteria bacterium]|nr:hypothetical protein [Vicinamibacteria bacterium]
MALVLAALLTGVSVYSVVAQNQRLAAEAKDLHFRWNTLAGEYNDLWDHIDEDDDPGLRIKQLALRAAEASRSGCGLPAKSRRIVHWHKVVLTQHGVAA